MVLELSDFLKEHRYVILLDIRKYSELNDNQQVEIIKLITNESNNFLDSSGFGKEKIFSTFIPTGDGFYFIGDKYNSIFWANICLIFALSLRNNLLDSINKLDFNCDGVQLAIHFGTTLSYKDISNRENFAGAAMNETARLLSPINKDEIKEISHNFYGHENSVIISDRAYSKIEKTDNFGIKVSKPFTIRAKHKRSFKSYFIDSDEKNIVLISS